jgi:hypothetical protein
MEPASVVDRAWVAVDVPALVRYDGAVLCWHDAPRTRGGAAGAGPFAGKGGFSLYEALPWARPAYRTSNFTRDSRARLEAGYAPRITRGAVEGDVFIDLLELIRIVFSSNGDARLQSEFASRFSYALDTAAKAAGDGDGGGAAAGDCVSRSGDGDGSRAAGFLRDGDGDGGGGGPRPGMAEVAALPFADEPTRKSLDVIWGALLEQLAPGVVDLDKVRQRDVGRLRDANCGFCRYPRAWRSSSGRPRASSSRFSTSAILLSRDSRSTSSRCGPGPASASTSLQRESSARARSGENSHASRAL